MPYPISNSPREIEAAFTPPPGIPQTPPRWDPYPRYIDNSEMEEILRYRPTIIVLTPDEALPPGMPDNTLILRIAT